MHTRPRYTQTNIYTREQIKRVLAGAGINVESEVDSDYIIFCPFHSNTRTPAGEVDKNTGKFFCFSCQHVSDLVELVMHTTSRSYFESVRFIKSKEQDIDLEKEINKTLYTKPEYVEFDHSIIERLHEQAKISKRALDYLYGRKITDQSISKFKIGYSETQDMITIPVYNHESLCVGFVARSIEGKDFKNTPGLPKSKLLFNLNNIKASNRVYIVESSFDAIRLSQVGIPSVATLGANVSSAQIELLKKYFNNIFLIADNDEAGNNMKKKLIEKLGSSITIIPLNNKYKDVGDMNDEAIKELDYSFDKSIMSMLQ